MLLMELTHKFCIRASALTLVPSVNAPTRITSIGRSMKKSMNIPTLAWQVVTGMLRRRLLRVRIVASSTLGKSISKYMVLRGVTPRTKDGRKLSST